MAKRNDKKIVKTARKQINERRVKALLAERGWIQADLARESGIGLAYLNRIIRNERYIERHVTKIASALGVSVRRIINNSSTNGSTTTALAAQSGE